MNNQNIILYRYEAYDAVGKTHSGYVYGPDSKAVSAFLQESELKPLTIHKSHPFFFYLKSFILFFLPKYRINKRAKMALIRNMGELLRNNQFPVAKVLLSAMRNTQCVPLKREIYKAYALLNQGFSLAFSLSQVSRRIFSLEEVNLIRFSERAKGLDEVFVAIADDLEEKQRGRFAIYGYLASMIGTIVLLIILSNQLAQNIIPVLKIHSYLEGYNLPPFILAYNWIFGGALPQLFLTYFLLAVFIYTLVGRLVQLRWLKSGLSYIKLILPGTRNALRYKELANFCYSLSLAVKAKMPIQQAFSFAADAILTHYYRKNTQMLAREIRQGYPLREILSDSRLFSKDDQYLLVAAAESKSLQQSAETLKEYAHMKLGLQAKLYTAFVKFIFMGIIFALVVVNLIVLSQIFILFIL